MPRWARWSVALVIGAIALSSGPRAHAQATVVASCGTPPATLPLGTVQPLFMDQTGTLCAGASLAGGSTGVSGANSTTGTGATTLIAAQGAGVKIYVTSAQCFRTDAGATMDYVTLNDSASTTIPVPAGGGAVPVFNTPLSVAANTALTFAPNAGVSTMFCNAQGYKGL